MLIVKMLRSAAKITLSMSFPGVFRNAKLRYFPRKSKPVKVCFVRNSYLCTVVRNCFKM